MSGRLTQYVEFFRLTRLFRASLLFAALFASIGLAGGLPARAAEREERFKEYDGRRKEALEKMAPRKDLNGALARLYLNKDAETANRIILESELQHWTDHIPQLALYKMFNADTGNRAKLLSREATDKLHAHMWECFQPKHGKPPFGACRHFYPIYTGDYWGNQNHGFVFQSWFYIAAAELKGIPKYADQFNPEKTVAGYKKPEGAAALTLEGYAEDLHQLWRNRPLRLAQQGLWAEDSIYRCYSIATTYNMAYHADDPDIRRRAAMILDLHWLIYSLHMVDGQLGGAMNRLKEDFPKNHADRGLGHYYFGGDGFGLHSTEVALLGDYLPPRIAYDLLADPKKRGSFVYRERLTQFAAPGQPPPTYKYNYVTPEYVLGSFIAHDLAKGPGRYAERAFNGVAFGKARAMLRLGPAAKFESYHCLQNGPILLARWYGRGAPSAAIIVREAGGAPIKPAVAENDWVFGEAGDAYYALRSVVDKVTVNGNTFSWGSGSDPLPPNAQPFVRQYVVLRAGGATEDGSFEDFKKKVLAGRVECKGSTLVYQDAQWGTMEFCGDPSQPPDQWRRINGKPVELPNKLFDSPYLTSDYDSGVVKAEFNGRKLTLDFNTGERTEE